MTDEVSLKPALSVEQQIKLLSERGLIIDDPGAAKKFLLENNYYRINIYFHKLMVSKDCFPSNVTFSKIIDIYENDKWLRSAILRILEPIEIKLKAVIAYYLGNKYGPNAFYNDKIYVDQSRYQEVLKNFEEEVQRSQFDSIVRYHQDKFGGLFPIWVIVEFLSLNSISKYFKNLLPEDKKIISQSAFLVKGFYLGQWTQALSVMRNTCAHYAYLYKREYTTPIDLGNFFAWNNQDNRNLFSVFLITRKLSNSDNWKCFVNKLYERNVAKSNFILSGYGFPSNWLDYLS